MKFSLITPDRVMFSDVIDSVTIPTTSGEIQVLAHHMPLVSQLAAGELVIRKAGDEIFLAVSHGFVEVRPNNEVVVLANTAEHAGDIDEERAQAARERARELLSQKQVASEEFATVAAAIEKEFARVKVARKHRSHISPLGEGVKRNIT